MSGKSRVLILIFISVVLILSMGGCSSPGVPEGAVGAHDIALFQKMFMASYYADHGGIAAGVNPMTPFSVPPSPSAARATVPVNQLTDIYFSSLSPTVFGGYPEPGQSTSFTLGSRDAANHVYDITATTTFPSGDQRGSYVEEYYVRDIGKNGLGYFDVATPDGKWTVDDPVVAWNGSAWEQDQKSRVKMELTFADGTKRTETIASQTDFITTLLPKFSSFDVNGSLDFGQFFYPATDSAADFSSVVVYKVTPSTNPDFWFWEGSDGQNILGIRYYTEKRQGGKLYATTVAFEKTLSTLSTQAVADPQVWATVFVGSEYDTLAESVLRQQVIFDLDGNGNPILSSGARITKMESRVVDITDQKDFYLQQLDSDYVTLSGWDATTVYTPTGDAEEILAADPSKFLYGRTLTGASGGQPLAVSSTSGLGDLAGLYTAIQSGAPAGGTGGTSIPGAIPSATQDLQFNGNQGSVQTHQAAFDLSTTGTVEAWVYVKQHTDTGGIVHKGVLADFSDECYSLQFWGNQGQVAFILDPVTATGSGGYDLITSTINLNTARWYYLVATWDSAAGTPYLKLYIDGAINRTITPAQCVAHGGARANGSDLLIGSQLPVEYNVAYGYFGLNGAINGVRVSGTPMDAAAVLTEYNTYKDQTSGWTHP
jgi:hypothetical protein